MSELNVLTQEQAVSIGVKVKFSRKCCHTHSLHTLPAVVWARFIDRSRKSFEFLSGTSSRAERVLRWCVFLPPACVHDYGRSCASAAFHYEARCWCIRMSLCVHPYAVNYVRARVSGPHALLDTASSASTLRRDPCLVRTRDRWTEARTGSGPLCTRSGRPHPSFPGVTWRHAS